MFCDLELQPTPSFSADYCGSCRRCIDACPTGCIQENHTIDSSCCISYLTIENKGTISSGLISAIGSHVFGCDICQQVCPWNRKTPAHLPLLEFQTERLPGWIDVAQAFDITKEQFKERFSAYPISRAKLKGFLRNAVVVIGNAHQPESISLLQSILESKRENLVRIQAIWALKNIETAQTRDILRRQLSIEQDSEIREEILLALS
jgi:epoxyqueuosine reductase